MLYVSSQSQVLHGHAQTSRVWIIQPRLIAWSITALWYMELHDVCSFCEVYGHTHIDETRGHGNLCCMRAAVGDLQRPVAIEALRI